MATGFVREQNAESLKVGIKELKKECADQRARVRGARNILGIQRERLKELNKTLRIYRQELHHRRNGKKRKK